MTVLNIEDHKPHVVVCGKSVHVVPVSMFNNIINGTLKSKDIEDLDDMLPRIIKEWLDGR